MAQVTFPPELGGDGNTYSDDSNPATGLGNGGHRTRFVPALGQGLAMAATARDKAGEAFTSAQNAATSESNAGQSATAAADSASAANTSAQNAATSESNAGQSATSAADSASAALTQANRAETEADRAQQAALESDIYWHSEVTGHGTGFLNHDTTVLSADDGTRTLTISPAGGATEFLTFDHNQSIPITGAKSYQVADADGVSYLIFPRKGEQPGTAIPIISGVTDCVAEDSNYIYIGVQGSITILRKGDMSFVENPPQLPTAGARPYALSVDSQLLYVSLNEAPYLMVFEIGSWNEVTGYPTLPDRVPSLAQDTSYIYLGGFAAPHLYVIEKATKTLLPDTPTLDNRPVAIVVYGEYLVMDSGGRVRVYSNVDFSLLHTINPPGTIAHFDVGASGVHVVTNSSPHYYVFELDTGAPVSGPPSLDGLLSFGAIAKVKVTDTEVYLSLDYVEDPYFYRISLSDWSLNAIPLPNLTGTNAVQGIACDSDYLYLVTYKGFTVVDRSTNTNITTVPQPVDALFDAGNNPGYNQRLVFLYGYDSENAHFWYVGDERHGTDRTDENHAWRHETFGLQWTSGGAVSYTLNDPSNIDLTLAGPIVLRDEDIRRAVSHSATPTDSYQQSLAPLKTTAVYRKANGNATATSTVSDSIWNMGTAAVTYNPEVGGIADVPDGKFVNYTVLFTMDFRAGKSIKSVMGRQVHDTLDDARGEAFIQGDLPHQEMRFAYIVTAKVNYAITENPYKLELVEVRNAENPVGSVPVPAAASHDQLIHKEWADQHPIGAITGLQTALEDLDQTKVENTDPRLSDAREWTAETVSQAEAEAGTGTTRRAWTVQRVWQAIYAQWMSVTSTLGRTLVGRSTAAEMRGDLGLGSAATADVTTSNLDTTAERLLKTNDFGLGNAILLPQFANLDQVLATGFYRCNNPTGNLPVGAQPYGLLLVIRGLDTISQTYVEHFSGRQYTRGGSPPIVGGAGDWYAWRKTLNDTDVTTSETDTTAGRLLKTDDQDLVTGLRTPYLSGDGSTLSDYRFIYSAFSNINIGNDFNNLIYATPKGFNIDNPNGTWTNAPIADWLYVEVFHHSNTVDENWVMQRVTTMGAYQGATRLFVRLKRGGVWSAWREIYHTDNTVGTVSQTDGVPTGAIIEQGSNANGRYVKYADGTMICYNTVSETRSFSGTAPDIVATTGFNVTFPVSFVGAPSVTATGDVVSVGYASYTPTEGGSLIPYNNALPSPRGVTIRYTAIGRWF